MDLGPGSTSRMISFPLKCYPWWRSSSPNSWALASLPDSIKAKFQSDFAPAANRIHQPPGFPTLVKINVDSGSSSAEGKAVTDSSPIFKFASKPQVSTIAPKPSSRERSPATAPHANAMEKFHEMIHSFSRLSHWKEEENRKPFSRKMLRPPKNSQQKSVTECGKTSARICSHSPFHCSLFKLLSMPNPLILMIAQRKMPRWSTLVNLSPSSLPLLLRTRIPLQQSKWRGWRAVTCLYPCHECHYLEL